MSITDCDNVTLPAGVDQQLPGTVAAPSRATMCRKEMQRVGDAWHTFRSCAFIGSPGEGTGNENVCLEVSHTSHVHLESCTCNSRDGCNHGSGLAPSSLLLLVTAACILSFFFPSLSPRSGLRHATVL